MNYTLLTGLFLSDIEKRHSVHVLYLTIHPHTYTRSMLDTVNYLRSEKHVVRHVHVQALSIPTSSKTNGESVAGVTEIA